MLTIAEVQKALPVGLKNAATQELVDRINTVTGDPVAAEAIRDNFMSFTKVLGEGRFKTEDYLHAVTYVSFQLMKHTNEEAYFKTFPQRYAQLMAKGTSSKDIAAYVSMYNKGKLVNLIREQTLVPTWVLNADIYQKAINTQADLMLNAQSEKVRCEAANSILTHLAKPKDAGPLVNIDLRETAGAVELRSMLEKLATAQQAAIASGVSTKDIAGQKLEVIDV